MQIPKYTTYHQIRQFIDEHYSKTKYFHNLHDLILQMDKAGLFVPSMPEYPDYPGTNNALSNEEFKTFISSVPLNVAPFFYENDIDANSPFLAKKDIACLWYLPFANETLHTHKCYEITYVFKGTCCLLFENEKKMINTGNMIVITPNSRHNIIVPKDSIVIGIFVKRTVFDNVISNLLTDDDLVSSFFKHTLYDNKSPNYLSLSGIDLPPFRKNIADIFFECTNTRKYNRACSLGFFINLMACTLRRYHNSMTFHKTEPLPIQQNDFLYILEYMQQNYRTVTLTSLAETFHYTPAYLCKLFKKNIHQNFSDALRDLKMQKALEYLSNPTIRIADIADSVGYDSVEHFSRTFKKNFGISPLKYRSQSSLPQPAGKS